MRFNMSRVNYLRVPFLLIALAISAFATDRDLTPAEYERICKGAISAIFSPPIDTVQVVKKESEVLFLTYMRKGDGKIWNYRCKLVGSAVIWGAVDGRWRTDLKDDKIFFSVDRRRGIFTIRQAFGDGSSEEKEFRLVGKP